MLQVIVNDMMQDIVNDMMQKILVLRCGDGRECVPWIEQCRVPNGDWVV